MWLRQPSSRAVRARVETAKWGPHHQPITAMSKIDIRHAHSLPMPQARKAIEDVAKRLEDRFQIDYDWDGDILNFKRSGIDGHIEVLENTLHVHAKLGFLAAMFKDPIEAEIHRVLKEKF